MQLNLTAFNWYIFDYCSTADRFALIYSILGSVKLAQRLIPAVQAGDLRRGPCGIRAQAISSRGELVDDFVFGIPDSYCTSSSDIEQRSYSYMKLLRFMYSNNIEMNK